MANIPFKSIKFPGLPNKYTVPEISSDLMTQGKAADSKATGDALSALEDQFSEETDKLKADLADKVDVLTMSRCQRVEIPASSNKWNKSTVNVGMVDTNGNIYADGNYVNYCYSEPIDVSEGDVLNAYRLLTNGNIFAENMGRVTAYDSSGNAVTESGAVGVHTYTVPSGISSLIITISASYNEKYILTINETNVPTGYEDYRPVSYQYVATSDFIPSEAVEGKISNINPTVISGVSVIGGNIVDDAVEILTGRYCTVVNGRLSIIESSSYNSVIVPIKAKKYIQYKPSIYTNALRFVVLLESDKRTAIGTHLSVVSEFDNTDAGASYCAISYYVNAWDDLFVFPEGEPLEKTYVVSGRYEFENLDFGSSMHVYLPSEICVGVGRTIELYNNLVFLESDKYHINWSCSVGVAYKRKFSITGTQANIGTYPLTLNIYDDSMNLVRQIVSTLKIVDNAIESTLNIVPIGDSLTNGKAWLNEVQTLSDGKISYIGTRGTASLHHEGRSGASSGWYNSNSTYTFDSNYVGNPNVDGTTNPFWDGSKFSLSHYIDTQSAIIGSPDAVQILVGINGIAFDPTANVNNIVALVDSIRAEYADMPIFVCNTIYRSNQNGYYSTGADGYVPVADFQFGSDVKIMNLQTALAEALDGYTNVFIVPLSICMDRDNDFGHVEVPVNPRLTTVTDYIASESVHPQTAGYMQMADVIYSSYIAHLN